MKIKHLTAACALAFAGTAGQAHAFDTTMPALQVYLSGASAPQRFFSAIVAQLFEPGFRTYFDSNNTAGTGDDGRNYRAFIGTLRNADPVPPAIRGQQAKILYRTEGGSIFGVNPVARAQPLRTMLISRTDPAKPGDGTVAGGGCTAETGGSFRCPIVGNDPGVGTPTGQERVPDFGVSDLPPVMFIGAINNEFGATELTDAERAALTVRPAVGIAMGIVANQQVPATVAFSRGLYANLLAGNITDWSVVPGAGSGPVIVCRRQQGSGTQASYNWYMHDYPCTINTLLGTNHSVPARMSDTWDQASIDAQRAAGAGATVGNPIIVTSGVGGFLVIENSTSGDARGCLAAANTGGTHNFRWDNGEHMRVVFGAPRGAVGTLSLDSSGAAVGEGVDWSFRTLNGAGTWTTSSTPRGGTQTGTGIAPSIENMVNGSWDLVGELTLQFRNQQVGSVPVPTPAQQALIDTVIRQVGNPTVLNGQAVGAANSFVGLPTVADPATWEPAADRNRISNFSRVANMCQPPVFRPGVQ
jgi:hypothetical protein